MATYSNSPRLRAADTATPIHSPHHSVHSSASSRLSVRNLTLHEYRKQQSSPASHATPPGKTLRRKPAAFGLKENDRVPSPSWTSLPTARALPRQLHISQSTQSLYTYQQLPPSPPHHQHEIPADEFPRSQSAAPSTHYSETGKVRKFKPIKRLPKPLLSPGHSPSSIGQFPLSCVTPSRPPLSPLGTTFSPSCEHSTSNGQQPTLWPFSLSRFPRPPVSAAPPLLPLTDENEQSQINTVSFASTAPATPPATPAVIHYRGASFDLVNPHSSLVLDNVVTPSRELDSSDCLPLLSSEDLLASPEMAPKRPLYGDLSSAYASIIRRGDEYPSQLLSEMPLPPTPVAQSPGSSAFDSPAQSPEWHQIDQKPSNESHFSLKQVARSLTQRFSKVSERPLEQELQEFSESRVSLVSASFDGEFPRPLERSYRVASPKTSMFPYEPVTPVSPLDQAVHLMSQRNSPSSIELARSPKHFTTAALSSMFPDTPLTQLDRAQESQAYVSGSNLTNEPYYDDMTSIYPSSSIYTDSSRRQSSTYMQNRNSSRKSNPYYRHLSENADALANPYISDALSQHTIRRRTSHHMSKSFDQTTPHRPLQLESEKADTISKFIDQYENIIDPSDSQSRLDGEGTYGLGAPNPSLGGLDTKELVENLEDTTTVPAFKDFQHNPNQTDIYTENDSLVLASETRTAGKSALAPSAGAPPSVPAPLAPAFEYDESLESSKRFEGLSKISSYGNTGELLQFSSQPAVDKYMSTKQALQSSSSYSQPSISLSPQVPCQALRQAEEIFATDTDQREPGNIPTIWSKRVSSHNISRNMVGADSEGHTKDLKPMESPQVPICEDDFDRAEWETVGNGSPHRDVRVSVGESLANYSISEGSHTSRDSMGFSTSFPFPGYEGLPLELGTTQYHHLNPLCDRSNPFISNPPALHVDASTPELATPITEHHLQSSPSASSSSAAHVIYGQRASMSSMPGSPLQECFPSIPWADPYAFSDKETQELLASGPNDDILYEHEKNGYEDTLFHSQQGSSPVKPLSITISTGATRRSYNSEGGDRRENSFEKFTILGPKANLTGTPHGTGMRDTGSSVADNSSPGVILDSSPSISRIQLRNEHSVFGSTGTCNVIAEVKDRYHWDKSVTAAADEGSYRPYLSSGRKGSVSCIAPHLRTPPDSRERNLSPVTIHHQESPLSDHGRRAKRLSLHSGKISHDPRRRGSRAAVPGQTKLRQMVLAPNAQTLSSPDRSLNDSDPFRNEHSARPSTSNTATPLRTATSRPTLRTVFANQHSPHLLCPERALDPGEEAERRKLSWVIFAAFCVLPPILVLYRWMGDMAIVNVTNGRFSHVDPKPKNIALAAGIAVNAGIVAIILLPILIAHFAGSL